MGSADVNGTVSSAFARNMSTGHLQTSAQSLTYPDDCIVMKHHDMEFLPWDNPHNIVSVEVETIFLRIKNNLLVLLFLIGAPANVINMAVFYKQGLKDRVNLCLFAMSLADELYLITVMSLHAEQMYIQFTTQDRFGPVTRALTNVNLLTFLGFGFVSHVLSAIIATERCLCVYNPLKFQRLLRTRTMAVIVASSYVIVLGFFFIVAFRFRFVCVFDPTVGVAVMTPIEGTVYRAHKHLIDQLDSAVFGVGLPGLVTLVVTTTTAMTIVKLRQTMAWRSESSSSALSAQELSVTKMLVGSSVLFMACTSPNALTRFSWLFMPHVNVGRRNQNLFLTGLWIAELFSFFNSTLNIFVYYTMGSRYRATFWALLGRKRQAEKP